MILRSILIVIIVLFNNIICSAVEQPNTVVPQPQDIYWNKIKPYPYTMVIKSKRYGEFNITQEAEEALDGYRDLCKETDYSMEIPAVALVNKKREIVDFIYPPVENIFFLNIDIDKIYQYNWDNKSLMGDLKRTSLGPDQRDGIIQRIIANAIYHPLGKFSFVRIKNKRCILAEVLNERVILPIECVEAPLPRLIQKGSLRKDWYIVTTPNTCFWIDYFINYVEMKSKGRDIDSKIPIHLHPWQNMQWLLETPEKYWLSEYQIHLIPSGNDIEFFRTRFPDAKLYVILGRDLYSEELDWAVYDDLSLIEKEIEKLEQAKEDVVKIKVILENLKNFRGSVQRYYTGKGSRLIIDKEIDTLLRINKRQEVLLRKIVDYKKQYPWRLLNTSFFVPMLNRELAGRGWKIVSGSPEGVGYSLDKKEFYFKEGTTNRMDLFLFIMFKLKYLEAADILKDMCVQLDYLCIKYNHIEGFGRHLEYLSDIIRLNIWEQEKYVLIAREQINNGRYYLDTYNLGYYKETDNLKAFSEIYFIKKGEIIEVEDIIKILSQRHDIKNIEEFIMEFERQLMAGIADFT